MKKLKNNHWKMGKMKSMLMLLFLAIGLGSNAQKLDSVKIEGQYYYVYPYLQEASPSYNLMKTLTVKEKNIIMAENGFDASTLGYGGGDFYMEPEVKPSKSRIKHLRKNAERNYTIYVGEREVVPALDKLPNGKYIQYFSKYWRFNEKDEMVFEKQKIAGYFQLENNLLEGPALWLNMSGDTVKYGTFRQGLKEGLWLTKEFSTNDFYIFEGLDESVVSTEPDVVNRNTYANGILNGPAESFFSGLLSERGQYTDGEPSGEWFHYSPKSIKRNGKWMDSIVLTKHYTLADKEVVSHKPYIRSMFSDMNFPYKYYSFPDFTEPIVFMDFWKLNKQEEENFELPEEGMNSYEGEDYGEEYGEEYYGEEYYGEDYGLDYDESGYMWLDGKSFAKSKLIDSLGLINIYTGIYEEFWENGNLKVRLLFENGQLLKEDTIFWDNGKPADIVIFDPVQKQYENRKMDYAGVLYEVNIYDSLGGFIKQTLDPFYKDKHVLIDGLYAELVEDYLYLGLESKENIEWITYSYDRSDTLRTAGLTGKITLSKTWYSDSSNWQSNVYDADTRTLTEEIRSLNGTLISQAIMEYDEKFENVMGTSSAYVQGLELRKSFNGSYSSLRNYFAEDSIPATRVLASHLYELTEDKTLFYKDVPFNGELKVNLDAKKFGVSIGKNEVKINLSNHTGFLEKVVKDHEKFRKTGKSKYNDVMSISTQINEEYYNDLLSVFPELAFMLTGNNRSTTQAGVVSMENAKVMGSFLNGKPNGTWKSFDKNGKTIFECSYLNGELDGTIKMYAYTLPLTKKKNKKVKLDEYGYDYDYIPEPSPYDTLPAKKVYFVSNEIGVKNGQLHGDLLTFDWQGKVRSKVNYVNGYPEGPASEHNAVASTFMNFEDGQLDGMVKTFLHLPGKDSILLYELNYQNGSLQGESRSYHTNGKLSKRGFFLNGMPIDDYEGYDSLGTRFHYVKFQYSFPVEEKIWESNELSVRYLFDWRDSIYFKPADITQATSVDHLLFQHGLMGDAYTQPYFGRPSLVEKSGIDYHMTKYFPNDTVARDGALSKGKKTGCWKFYSYQGEKLYEVEYNDTILKLNDSIQFKSKGMLYDYDAKGNLLSKSYIIEKFEKYDCSHTDHYEVRQFYTVWEASDSLHRINGYVKNHYDNGVLQSEGNMKNGLPTGVWKYYDPFGKLNHVGEYKLGKRDGRWLSGDLSKSKYLGDICMNPNLPDLEEQMKYQEKMLDIYIRYFKMGKLLNSEYYDLNLNDYEDGTDVIEEEEE